MAKKRKKKKPQQGKRKNQNPKQRSIGASPNWHWERISGYHPAYCTCAACVNLRTGGRTSRPRQDDTSRDTLAGDLLLLDVLSELDSRHDSSPRDNPGTDKESH